MGKTLVKNKAVPYLLILPAFAMICLFKLYPIFQTLLEGVYVKGQFSLDTYKTVFSDSTFWNSLWVTVKINLVMIPFQITLSFVLAMLVNVRIKGIGIFRTFFYLPFTISLTVATILWSMIFNNNNGIINSLFGAMGIPAQGFLIDAKQALWCIVIIASWKGCGYWMMFLLAALKNIDDSIYESAKIDGAGFFKTIFAITIPLIKKVLLFVMVANTTANILLFVPMQLITKGGPERSTNVLMYEAYQSAFKYGNRPRSAVMVTVLLFLIIMICLIQFRLMNEKEEKGGK